MGFFDLFRRKPEIRADTLPQNDITPEINDSLLRALLGKDSVSKQTALEIPTVQACINVISSTISQLPIQLLRKKDSGDVEVIEDDVRIRLLNDDTEDTLTAKMFWRAMLEDYYLGKGGFAYLNKERNILQSIHYVNEEDVFIGHQNYDPIFKEYNINVQGNMYSPNAFLKILRKTRDGMTSRSIVEDNPLVLNVAFKELAFELDLVRRGGLKRGYIQPEKPITEASMNALKNGFKDLYSSNANVMTLNAGMAFKEASSSATEMQMNENKMSNAEEICKLFGIPASMICGSKVGNSMTDADRDMFIRACVAVMADIECSLNRDLLMESEKGSCYFSFNTKELTRGSIKERYEAYKIGLEKNFLQIDEVRQMEDMEPLGIEWIQLNLNTVFYNPTTKEIYTPNTNASANLETGEGANAGTVADNNTSEGGEQENESGTTS